MLNCTKVSRSRPTKQSWSSSPILHLGKTGNPLVSYLKLAISRTEVSCEDSAHYRCQMETIMADGSVKTYIKDTQISISGNLFMCVLSTHLNTIYFFQINNTKQQQQPQNPPKQPPKYYLMNRSVCCIIKYNKKKIINQQCFFFMMFAKLFYTSPYIFSYRNIDL